MDPHAGQGTFRSKYLQPTLSWNTGLAKPKAFVRTLTATDEDYQLESPSAPINDSFTSMNEQPARFPGSPSAAYEDLCISDELLAELEAEIEHSEQQTPRRSAPAESARKQNATAQGAAAQLGSSVDSMASDTGPDAHPQVLVVAEDSIKSVHGSTDADGARAHDMLLEALASSKSENAQLAAALADVMQQLEHSR